MNEIFTIKKDSWHFKWLAWYSLINQILDSDYSYDAKYLPNVITTEYAVNWQVNDNWNWKFKKAKDFCSYWRLVLLYPALKIGVNLAILIAIIVALFSIPLNVHFALLGTVAIIVLLVAIVLAISYVFYSVSALIHRAKKIKSNPSFMERVSASLHDKYCSLIKYEE